MFFCLFLSLVYLEGALSNWLLFHFICYFILYFFVDVIKSNVLIWVLWKSEVKDGAVLYTNRVMLYLSYSYFKTNINITQLIMLLFQAL